jgi:Holliday junction resolvase
MNLYRRGYRAELALVKLLRSSKEFHTVFRSAGSRSPFDVIAIGKSRILLCQVKTGKGRFNGERKKLQKVPVPRCARKQLWRYRSRVWEIFEIT